MQGNFYIPKNRRINLQRKYNVLRYSSFLCGSSQNATVKELLTMGNCSALAKVIT